MSPRGGPPSSVNQTIPESTFYTQNYETQRGDITESERVEGQAQGPPGESAPLASKPDKDSSSSSSSSGSDSDKDPTTPKEGKDSNEKKKTAMIREQKRAE